MVLVFLYVKPSYASQNCKARNHKHITRETCTTLFWRLTKANSTFVRRNFRGEIDLKSLSSQNFQKCCLKMTQPLLYCSSNCLKQRFPTGVPRHIGESVRNYQGCRHFSLLLIFTPILASSGVAKYCNSWPSVPQDKKKVENHWSKQFIFFLGVKLNIFLLQLFSPFLRSFEASWNRNYFANGMNGEK